jgi:hypothetical protein
MSSGVANGLHSKTDGAKEPLGLNLIRDRQPPSGEQDYSDLTADLPG